jgi:uncharacterized protein
MMICNFSRRAPEDFSGKNLNHFACDLSRPEAIEHAVGQARQILAQTPPGGLLLVNNSGFGAYGRFPEPDLARQLEMVDVNIRAVVHLTGLMLPLLRERGGAVVTVASTAAFQPTAYAATYGASKTFVLHWSLALNEELRGSGVRALAVCPGPVATPFFEAAGLRKGAVSSGLTSTPEAVVEATLRALARRKSQVVVGWKNKLYAFAGSRVSKPLAARIGAKVLARFRLEQVR